MLPAIKGDGRWCPNWNVTQNLPAGTRREVIEAEVADLDKDLTPAGRKTVCVAVDGLFDLGRGFAIRYDAEAATRGYCDALEGYPGWAIALAVERLRKTWTNHYQLPLPAEVVAVIPDSVRVMRCERLRLRAALEAFDRGEIEGAGERISPAELAALTNSLKGAA